MEVKETPKVALQYYQALLQEDSSNAVSHAVMTPRQGPLTSLQAAWRRKASVLRRLGEISEAVQELCAMLDTFYTEVEAWLELADMYSSCQQYVSGPFLCI